MQRSEPGSAALRGTPAAAEAARPREPAGSGSGRAPRLHPEPPGHLGACAGTAAPPRRPRHHHGCAAVPSSRPAAERGTG